MSSGFLDKINYESKFIDVYNFGDYIIRYSGVYYVGKNEEQFSTPSILPENHLRISLPQEATRIDFRTQMWVEEKGVWKSFATIIEPILGQHCYKCSGTVKVPEFDFMICP